MRIRKLCLETRRCLQAKDAGYLDATAAPEALLETALDYSRITDGAFDITYASVGFMYDFRAHKKPTAEEINSALPAVNYHHVVLDAAKSTVFFTQPGVRIDLGGIGKGYAVDRAVDSMRCVGASAGIVNAGGDLRVFGTTAGTLPQLVFPSGCDAPGPDYGKCGNYLVGSVGCVSCLLWRCS